MPVLPPDVGHQRFEFRTKVGNFLGWKGHVRDGDPGSLEANRPRLVVNGVFRNGAIESRPGQQDLNGNPLDDPNPSRIRLLADYQMGKALRMWMVVDGCPGAGAPGFALLHYDP